HGMERHLSAIRSTKLRLVIDGDLEETLAECDLAIASNSTIHVDALLAGVPSGYLAGGDHAPFDVQGFVSGGLVWQCPVEADRLDLEQVRSFYGRPEWTERLRRFANIDEREADVVTKFGYALARLIARERMHA
ncbi:MAG: hypothetical protein U0Q11_10560, partial [Vicinamibacterales bacterium]